MFIINLMIRIKECLDVFSNSIFYLIRKCEKYSNNRNVLFFVDKNVNDENIELIDSFSLFQKAVEMNLNAYYIIAKNNSRYNEFAKKYPKKILKYSNYMHIKHFFKFLNLKKVFTAYEFISPYNNYFYESENIDFIFIDHGVILLKTNIFTLYNQREFNKILVSNDIEAEIVKNLGGFKEENLIKVALPRFDLLEKEKSLSKSILFFPTWRISFNTVNYEKSEYYKKICEFLNNSKLKTLLQQNNITLNIAVHHSLKDICKNFVFANNIMPVDSSNLSNYIKSADLLITDYSSVWADFFFLNKPVIFFRPDEEDSLLLPRDKESMRASHVYNDLIFNVTNDENAVLDLIEKYISNNFELQNCFKMKQNRFFYTKENIREKILKGLVVNGKE